MNRIGIAQALRIGEHRAIAGCRSGSGAIVGRPGDSAMPAAAVRSLAVSSGLPTLMVEDLMQAGLQLVVGQIDFRAQLPRVRGNLLRCRACAARPMPADAVAEFGQLGIDDFGLRPTRPVSITTRQRAGTLPDRRR